MVVVLDGKVRAIDVVGRVMASKTAYGIIPRSVMIVEGVSGDGDGRVVGLGVVVGAGVVTCGCLVGVVGVWRSMGVGVLVSVAVWVVVSEANYDAFRPCLRVSSGRFDFVAIQRSEERK